MIKRIICLDCKKEIEINSKAYNQKRCFDCARNKNNELKRNYIMNNRDKHRKATESWRQKNLEHKSKLQKDYAIRNKKKIHAHNVSQKIKMKDSCEICNSNENLQRHHWRYDKPLMINTLCQFCHNVQHGRGGI